MALSCLTHRNLPVYVNVIERTALRERRAVAMSPRDVLTKNLSVLFFWVDFMSLEKA